MRINTYSHIDTVSLTLSLSSSGGHEQGGQQDCHAGQAEQGLPGSPGGEGGGERGCPQNGAGIERSKNHGKSRASSQGYGA